MIFKNLCVIVLWMKVKLAWEGLTHNSFEHIRLLTFPMLRLLSFKAQECNNFLTPKPCHVGIHWIALVEYSQISTHMAGL